MERWCYQVLLVLCLASVLWNVIKADEETDKNFRNHACTYFKRLDWDEDLELSVVDFAELAAKTVTVDVAPTVWGEIKKGFKIAGQFLNFFPLVDVSTFRAIASGGVPLKEFLTSITKRRCTSELVGQIEDMVNFIHEVYNADGDDMNLTKRELGHMYEVFRIDASALDAGFSDLDQNHDSVITVPEANASAQLYFCGAPIASFSQSWCGPIITCEELVKGDLSKLP